MKYFLLFIISGVFGHITAQQTDTTTINYFKILNDDANEGVFVGCDLYEDGYIAVGSSATDDGTIYLALKTYNFKGELTGDFSLDNWDNGFYQINYGKCLVKVNEEEWILAYQSNNGNDTNIRIIKFNINGEVLWETNLGDNFSDKAKKVMLYNEDKIVIIGERQINSSTIKGYSALLNQQDGSLIWERLEEDAPYNALASHSGGVIYNDLLILGGGREVQGEFYSYIKKVSLITHELIDEIIYYENVGCTCHIREIENQNDLFHFTSCSHEEQIVNVSRIDSDLNIIWEHTYNMSDYIKNAGIKPIIYEDGSLVSLNEYKIYTDLGLRSQIRMYGLDPEGNVSFVTKIPTDTTKEVYVRDLRKTPDGGYIIAGFEYFPLPQRGWLIKTDSIGNTCQLPNCDSVAYVIDTIFTNNYNMSADLAGVKVFPNPTQANSIIHFQLNNPNDAIVSSAIFSIDGKQLFVSNEGNEQQIKIPNIPSGVYMLKLHTRSGIIYSRRLVIN